MSMESKHSPESDIVGLVTKELSPKLHILTNDQGQRVFLLGTAHVSLKSSEDAQRLVRAVKPRVLFLELCEQRRQLFAEPQQAEPQSIGVLDVLRRAAAGEDLLFLLLSSLLHAEADRQGVEAGAEFSAALDAAHSENADVEVVCGDRAMEVTMSRVVHGLSLLDRCLFGIGIYVQSKSMSPQEMNSFLEEVRSDAEVAEEMNEAFRGAHPWVAEAMIDERDAFLVLEMKDALQRTQCKDMVAIVGAAHVSGIKKVWDAKMSPEEAKGLKEFLSWSPSATGPLRPKAVREYAKLIQHDYFAAKEYRDEFVRQWSSKTSKDVVFAPPRLTAASRRVTILLKIANVAKRFLR